MPQRDPDVLVRLVERFETKVVLCLCDLGMGTGFWYLVVLEGNKERVGAGGYRVGVKRGVV